MNEKSSGDNAKNTPPLQNFFPVFEGGGYLKVFDDPTLKGGYLKEFFSTQENTHKWENLPTNIRIIFNFIVKIAYVWT